MDPSGNGGKVVCNSTVVLRCTINKNILGHGAVEWYRRQGENRYQLGSGSSIHSHLTTAARYHLQTESQTSSTAVYRLTITGMYSKKMVIKLVCMCVFSAIKLIIRIVKIANQL